MFTRCYKSTLAFSSFFTPPFQIFCLKLFNVDCTNLLIQCELSVQLSYLFWSLNWLRKLGTKFLSLSLFFFLHCHIIGVHFDCVFGLSFWTVISFFFFSFHMDWKAALFFIFGGVVLWTLLFMYLVTSLKCLALLQDDFCNFACFTNAS